MRLFIAIFISALFCTPIKSLSQRPADKTSTKMPNTRPITQSKRDLSLSYSATDIDSKKGTRVKTITVIKNLADKNKNQPLAINPELHKNEEWATAFRDNFDTFGKLPDVPSIDELFEFMHKNRSEEKVDKKSSTPPITTTTEKLPPPSEKPKDNVKPVKEESMEVDEGPVEKIKGDAELLPNKKSSNKSTPASKSQSLTVEKYQVQEPLVDLNYSTPDDAIPQHFEKYVQQSSNGYEYEKPCVHTNPPGSLTVTTTAGRSYDIPLNNNNVGGGNKPYIAPAITKKTQVQQTSTAQGGNLPVNPPTYPVNSLLPPLNQQSNVGSSANAFPPIGTLQPPLGIRFTTTQRAYIAPNLRNNGIGINLGTPALNSYRGNIGSTNYYSRFNGGRSRGLKY